MLEHGRSETALKGVGKLRIEGKAYEVKDGGEGTGLEEHYEEVTIDGLPCYRKFRDPGDVHIVVAGGTAGKFSAVMGGWGGSTAGSEPVTYPVE